MLLRPLNSLLLLVAARAVSGLKDAYPFILLSTEEIPSDVLKSSQIASADAIQNDLASVLSSSKASKFIFIEQPGAYASDLRDGSAMPNFRKRMEDKSYQSVIQIPDVLGGVDLFDKVRAKVDLEDKTTMGKMGSIPRGEDAKGRRAVLRDTDDFFGHPLDTLLSNHTSHIIVFAASPAGESDYQMDEPPFQENLHTDLKRDVDHGLLRRQKSGNDDFQKDLPLFEKYQFLTPGIFMGLTVSILLFAILYVGITAIAGLEVSYMAFSKENGPQAQQQKKQQ